MVASQNSPSIATACESGFATQLALTLYLTRTNTGENGGILEYCIIYPFQINHREIKNNCIREKNPALFSFDFFWDVLVL